MLHIKSVKPLFTSILTTGDKYEKDGTRGGIIMQEEKKGDVKLYQKVLAIGSSVRDIKVGDLVMINPINYVVRKYDKNSIQNDMDNNPKIAIKIPTVIVDDEHGESHECLLINDRDVQFVFEGEEASDSIILPDKPKIITGN